MPGISPEPSPRILQWLELQTIRGYAYAFAIGKEKLPVCRYEVRHRPAFPHVSMQPEAAIHRVNHSLSAGAELSKTRCVC